MPSGFRALKNLSGLFTNPSTASDGEFPASLTIPTDQHLKQETQLLEDLSSPSLSLNRSIILSHSDQRQRSIVRQVCSLVLEPTPRRGFYWLSAHHIHPSGSTIVSQYVHDVIVDLEIDFFESFDNFEFEVDSPRYHVRFVKPKAYQSAGSSKKTSDSKPGPIIYLFGECFYL
ncbi:hypothetical protein NEUTE1DRAFT_138445 [Neurospora tetrasperma FGSC 2508]|uniref:Uncharacterized protein n=1 Tax=Neurospora tetrasperma (strain FGSC 2508 / ATCC MYA-4615 / P0657) TaxID=510951 RepID=F8MPA6_NEUT8|nr:uncharacterized protein NEUTE1DRAFT_138445 [Neurospora tetrasperma FGSC 2508]EGO56271.1 hypothetical protein NEUTE1DRAFT_138445 [Neurospora tetrasperma FGSC 2508]